MFVHKDDDQSFLYNSNLCLQEKIPSVGTNSIAPLSGTSVKSKVDDIVQNGDLTGAKTEALSDEIFQTEGFVKQPSTFGSNNGFDGVYIKKDASGNVEEIIINEAKQVANGGNIKLNGRTPNKGPQMSEEWIGQTITQMRNSSNNELKNLGDLLFNNRDKVIKTVTGVDKATNEIVILKLSTY